MDLSETNQFGFMFSSSHGLVAAQDKMSCKLRVGAVPGRKQRPGMEQRMSYTMIITVDQYMEGLVRIKMSIG
jgi:hypothetical protein